MERKIEFVVNPDQIGKVSTEVSSGDIKIRVDSLEEIKELRKSLDKARLKLTQQNHGRAMGTPTGNDSLVDMIKEEYAAGVSLGEIQNNLGVTESYISVNVEANRLRRHSATKIKEIMSMSARGASTKYIAKVVGIRSKYVGEIIRRKLKE